MRKGLLLILIGMFMTQCAIFSPKFDVKPGQNPATLSKTIKNSQNLAIFGPNKTTKSFVKFQEEEGKKTA